MSLRKIFDTVERPHVGIKCRTCTILEELQGDDRVVLEEWIADLSKSASMIKTGLAAYGYTVSTTALSRHRRECR